MQLTLFINTFTSNLYYLLIPSEKWQRCAVNYAVKQFTNTHSTVGNLNAALFELRGHLRGDVSSALPRLRWLLANKNSAFVGHAFSKRPHCSAISLSNIKMSSCRDRDDEFVKAWQCCKSKIDDLKISCTVTRTLWTFHCSRIDFTVKFYEQKIKVPIQIKYAILW